MRRLRSFDLDLNQFPNKDLIVKFTLDLKLTKGLESISQICKHINSKMVYNKNTSLPTERIEVA